MREFKVPLRSYFSRYYPIYEGAPHRSVRSPLLYSVYAADIRLRADILVSYTDDKAVLRTDPDVKLGLDPSFTFTFYPLKADPENKDSNSMRIKASM